MHVFVADDDPSMLDLVASTLRRDGISVVEATSGADLIRRLGEGIAADLVITDVNMPGVDGIAVLKHLHEREPEVPVILMSSFAGTQLRDRAAQVGPVAAVLSKPFRLDELRALVAKHRPESPPQHT